MDDQKLKAALGDVFGGVLRRAHEELQAMKQEDLEQFWFFQEDATWRPEWRAYEFFKCLEMYRSKCRRWEEIHNPDLCCVVERVRDTYLMPKIKEFLKDVK